MDGEIMAACVMDRADRIDFASCLSVAVLAVVALRKVFLLSEVVSSTEIPLGQAIAGSKRRIILSNKLC